MGNFTEKEVIYLKSRGFDYATTNTNRTSKSYNQWFGLAVVKKLQSNEIEYVDTSPTNVDPDDGSYDNQTTTWLYKNFDDFKARKHYKKTQKYG